MDHLVSKLRSARKTFENLNTRQRIVFLICGLLFIQLAILTFGLTVIFTGGTALGVWCARKVRQRSYVLEWTDVIPFLPHIAKERPLYEKKYESERSDDQGTYGDRSRNFDQRRSLKDPNAPTILQTEESEYVRLMMRDFVSDWYRTLSDDDQFSHNVFIYFKDILRNAKSRLSRVDQRKFLCILLNELRAHIDIFRRLQMSRARLANHSTKLGRSPREHSIVSIYETFANLHPAAQNLESEKDHLSQLANCLILALLPQDVNACSTLFMLLQDFLSSNVLQSVVQLISDPDFVNEIFIMLLTDEPDVEGDRVLSESSADGERGDVKSDDANGEKKSQLPEKEGHEKAALNRAVLDSRCEREKTSKNDAKTNCGVTERDPSSKESNHFVLPGETDRMANSTVPSGVASDGDLPIEQLSFPVPMTMIEPSRPILKVEREKMEGPQHYAPEQKNFAMPLTMLEPAEAVLSQCSDKASSEAEGIAVKPNKTSPVAVTAGILTTDLEQGNNLVSAEAQSASCERSKLVMLEQDPNENLSGSEVNRPMEKHSFSMPLTMIEPSIPVNTKDSGKIFQVGDVELEAAQQMPPPEDTNRKIGDKQINASDNTLKLHRRSASTGSNIFDVVQSPSFSQSSGSVIDSMVDSTRQSSFPKVTSMDTMRSCFSADCLPKMGDDELFTSQDVSSCNVDSPRSLLSALSLASSSELYFSFGNQREHRNSETSEDAEVPTPDGSQADSAEIDVATTDTGSPRKGKSHLIRQQTAPAGLGGVSEEPSLLPPSTGDIPLAWASWRVSDLRIPTTSWLGDHKGKKPVVYFVVKYTLFKKPTMSDQSEAAFSSKTEREVNRRYREFVNLHVRLLKNHQLRRHIKGVANVPKESVLPMTRIGPALQEQKRTSLETYLLQLLSRPLIHNSREMAEFLAIDGDGHIEFVKKAANQIPRIDKVLFSQVAGFVGTIKTILPERTSKVTARTSNPPLHAPPLSPGSTPKSTASIPPTNQAAVPWSRDQQEPIMKQLKRRISMPAFDSHLTFATKEDQVDGAVMDTSRDRLFGLDEMRESRVQRAMQILLMEKRDSLAQRHLTSPHPNDNKEHLVLGPRSAGDGSDSPNDPCQERAGFEEADGRAIEGKDDVNVYQAVYGVLSEALFNRQSFVLDKNLQLVLRVLVGGLIDKWLMREVERLFTQAQWGYYLSLLRDQLWPNGVWGPKERGTKTTEELVETKDQALHELTHNAAAAVLSLLVGEEHIQEGISLILDSLQDRELNKHLVFTFLDHAMDQLIPELEDPKFQSLLDDMP